MKAQDLMIGDWVLHFGEIAQIAGIRADNSINSPHILTNLHDFWYELGNEGIEPIPLTAEILEKNGFVFQDLPFENYYEGYGLCIHGGNYADGSSNWYITCGTNISIDVSHVHQLQHILRLSGVEKEIVI